MKKSILSIKSFALTIVLGISLVSCTNSTTKEAKDSNSNGSENTSDSIIKVGILHSLSGTMSISEVDVKNAELMAIDEINAAGGLLGKKIVPVVEDGASDWPTFAEKATKLIDQDKVSTVFGCWTSASRKAVLPVFEQKNHLLFYPIQYEGMEASKNIVYCGAAPNQQIIPSVDWMIKQSKKKFFLVGSDYVFPRTANQIIKTQLTQAKVGMVGEEYVPLGHTEFTTLIEKIKASGADAVLNTLNGDSNVGFFKQLAAAGISAVKVPVMSYSIAEVELKGIGTDIMKGHYAAWNYFMTYKSPKNDQFIKAYQAKYGATKVTDDPIEAAYFAVYVWAEAVKKAGSEEVGLVRKAVKGVSFDAPEGKISIDSTNNHTVKNFMIGQVNSNGMFDIVFQSPQMIKPEPFPASMKK